jgi:hypothetical protein
MRLAVIPEPQNYADFAGKRALRHSLISNLFSLFCSNKFPVRTLAAIRQKCPTVGHIWRKRSPAMAQFHEFPCIFPC